MDDFLPNLNFVRRARMTSLNLYLGNSNGLQMDPYLLMSKEPRYLPCNNNLLNIADYLEEDISYQIEALRNS